MRRLFLWLLLLNAAFFAWQINRVSADYDPYIDRVKPGARDMQGVRTIYLLSEVGRTPRAAEPGPPAPPRTAMPAPLASPAQCFRAGPFGSSQHAREAETRLGAQGIIANLAVEEEVVGTMHWVSLPPFDSFDAAKQQFVELQQRGIADVGIVNEHPGYVVSLGFYRQPRSASRRHDDIAALGYRPRITDRLTMKQTWWLDFRRPAGSSENAALPLALAEALAGVTAQPRGCEALNGKLADTGR